MNKIKRKMNHLLLLALLPIQSFATSSNKLVEVFDHAETFLTSTLVKSVAVVAIASVGYMYLVQNSIDKIKAVSIIAAIGIIIGAPTLYDTFVG